MKSIFCISDVLTVGNSNFLSSGQWLGWFVASREEYTVPMTMTMLTCNASEKRLKWHGKLIFEFFFTINTSSPCRFGMATRCSHRNIVHQGTAVPSDFHRNLEKSSGQKYKIFPPVPPLKGSFSMSGIDKKGGGAREIKLRGESQGCSFPA